MKIIINLSEAEVLELNHVIDNGWGDGDCYQLNNEHPPSANDRRRAATFERAWQKWIKGVASARKKEDSP